MSYYDYDHEFYDEPSGFEQQIDEWKTSLANTVKREIQEELESLRKENATLQDFKKRKDEIELEHRNKLCEMRMQIESAERKYKNAKLRNLLGEHLGVAWGVKKIPQKPPKCDKCDENRKFHFMSPSGKDMTEPCDCDKTTYLYEPQELSLVKFYSPTRDRSGDEYIERHFVKVDTINSDYDEYRDTTNVYKDGEPFDKIHHYSIVFLKKEDCLRYCEWYNSKTND